MHKVLEEKLKILNEHYSETVHIISHFAKIRDRVLIYFIIILVFMYIQFEVPQMLSLLANNILNKYIENKDSSLSIILTEKFINNLLWFLALGVSLKYFNSRLQLRRLRKYAVKIEDKICNQIKIKNFIYRERDAFKSSAIWTFHFFILILHRVVFTLIVLLVTSLKINQEIKKVLICKQ